MEPPDVLSASEPMPLVMVDHQPSLTPGDVITRSKGLENPQGPHRVHIEYMGPGFVVDIAGLLPRRAGNPGAVDEHVYGDIFELRCGVPDAFGIGHVHCNDIEHAPCVLRQASELACGVRVAARGKYAPSVSQVLTGKFEAEPRLAPVMRIAAAIGCCPFY